MFDFKQNRYTIVAAALLLTIIILGIGQAVIRNKADAQPAFPRAYVLGAAEGEHLMRNGRNLFIKADPSRISNSMALGTQQVGTC